MHIFQNTMLLPYKFFSISESQNLKCTKCNTVNEKGDKFCSNCSNNLLTQAEAPTIQPKENKIAPQPDELNLAARNMKRCPICTTECDIKRNFCLNCPHKFEKVVTEVEYSSIKNRRTSIEDENATSKYFDLKSDCNFIKAFI